MVLGAEHGHLITTTTCLRHIGGPELSYAEKLLERKKKVMTLVVEHAGVFGLWYL